MATSMRQRSGVANKISRNSELVQPEDSKSKTKGSDLLSQSVWFILLGVLGMLFYFIHVKSNLFPTPKTVSSARPGEFVEDRARRYLNELTALGPREVGSEANEVKAVEYLLKQLAQVQRHVHGVHEMQVDVQSVSGTFTLKFLGEFSSVYENVKNVVVKFGPRRGAKDSLLVNCHYDTVLDSPGASDDAVTCCLMLEVLNILSVQEKALRHNVIFVFNGAEENILQASHGFITQHPWAEGVRAFINLDSAGAGGRELLFQAGPEHPWLTQIYAQNVPHPFASVFGQEVFESGFIPSDTDFRIYRDYGNIPGLDIAYIHNGYVYHTKWDQPHMIPAGCIQRGGENLLALVQSLADSPLLTDPGEYKHGHVVFFDVVGLFVVLYPARIGNIVNVLMVVVVLVGIMRKVLGTNRGSNLIGQTYLKHLLKAIGVLLLSWSITMVVALTLGYSMNAINRPMSWFSRPWILIGLYVAPALLTNITIYSLVKRKLYKGDVNMWDVEGVYFDAAMLIDALVLGAMTYCGINSAVLFLISVLFPLLLRDRLAYLLNVSFRENHIKFVTLHLVGTFFPCLLKLYFLYGVLDMFIPVMGRIGTTIIPDVFIAGTVTFLLLIIMANQMQLVYVMRSIHLVWKFLAGIFAVTLLAVTLTPVGFPYVANPAAPARQRQIIHHVDRTFHDVSGAVTRNDSGIWVIPFDNYALRPLDGHVPMLTEAQPASCDGPYCGWPYYFAMLCIMRDSYYIPAAPLSVKKPEFHVLSQTSVSPRRLKIHMEMSGPHHINVYLTPKERVTLTRWSVGNGIPHPTATPPEIPSDTFFIYYAYGTKPDRPWQFWVELEIEEGVDRTKGVLDIALGGHYWFGDERITPALETYLGQLPDWTFPVAWSATYEAWTL